MHKKFEINQSKIKGGCQSGRKAATHDSKSDLPLEHMHAIRSLRQIGQRLRVAVSREEKWKPKTLRAICL